MKTLHHFIGGHAVAGTSGRFGDVTDPATGEITAKVPLASKSEVEAAIANAHAAFPAWAAVPAAKRAQVLFHFRDLIIKDMDNLARLVSTEHGKTIPDAKGSIARGLEVVEYACGIPQLLKGEITEQAATGVDVYSLRQPLGVCAGITPFNFPAMVPLWMFPMAIACGNSFVLKPSEKDPSTSLRLAELMLEAGLPEGVLNVVMGDKDAVDTLIADPRVPALSFVGSTGIGRQIYANGAAHGKRVQALCGAKNHLVVMPDADMDQVTDALMGAAYGSAGERCMAVSVAVAVGEETADEVIRRLAPRVRDLKVGPYTDAEAEMGPVITKESLERIKGYVDAGVKAGAKLVVDGRDLVMQGHENGFFLGGCLFDRVTPEMSIYTDEIFGPVLAVVRVADYETALGLVNDHQYGNGTAIFTRDGDAARNFVARVQAGMVGVNVPIPVPVAYHSFGGWKQSLFGDLHIYGPDGVKFYTKQKAVTARWPSGIRSGAQFHFKSGAEH
ncbi:methylmalonate-semialdehyde dehydrogenase (CoA acylating) [Telmatospirillum siberiense]|uniref:methylmalonate-semialdehyde dehydrogenase (CoA acylating) n=1 Tax=Telmatospirillum siberiense TaxID=382514 RepID=A0A2N3PVK8_9PROT|nr:CoA-acylating methylmalonate-semialdehyde dehydrogenase [Telmatospirillum siberiense]PKU24442.1 methylmalonate-semialdehyde dehydrogenase (CoA acylating) [Telmatospirillum siberiense]